MRILKFRESLDWKYILGEILLIFIGISLAIWFNNWNSSVNSAKEKRIAVSKMQEEIQNNLKELLFARKINQQVKDAYSAYEPLYNGNSNEILTTPANLVILQKKYPNFFTVTDSVKVEQGLYRYQGSTFINLELAELSKIAWETTKSFNTANVFNYECLYILEGMYNLQGRVVNEIEKAARALQKAEMKELMRVLEFLSQYDIQLEEDYNNMLKSIDNCR
ncbi:MAG: hypothetical protein NXI23_10405 [Bacteroidetes bacterium]|jgi:hypothetical protein|nr:hypothetical protein [Bacteroidota bacterium]MDF1864109.1 hypothetical protein [Saprospiraceae bacterium]